MLLTTVMVLLRPVLCFLRMKVRATRDHPKLDRIVGFLARFEDVFAQKMPNSGDSCLYLHKKNVSPYYSKQLILLYLIPDAGYYTLTVEILRITALWHDTYNKQEICGYVAEIAVLILMYILGIYIYVYDVCS